MKNTHSRFIFHTHAAAAGGTFRAGPLPAQTIPVSASVALPASGGSAESKGRSFNNGVVAWGASKAAATGTRVKPSVFESSALARVEKVSVLGGRLKAAMIESQLTNSFKAGGPPAMVPVLAIEGLVIDGKAVTVNLESKVCSKLDTLEKLLKAFKTVKAVHKLFAGLFRSRSGKEPAFGKGFPLIDGKAVYSIVRSITIDGKEMPGYVHEFDGLGTVTFGQVIRTGGSLRLIGLRIEGEASSVPAPKRVRATRGVPEPGGEPPPDRGVPEPGGEPQSEKAVPERGGEPEPDRTAVALFASFDQVDLSFGDTQTNGEPPPV